LNKDRLVEAVLILSLIVTLIPVLASGFRLLTALDAGALIALPFPHFSQNASLGAASLKTLQSAVQAFAFLHMYFGHLFSLPPIYPA
jgi:hypothetical protein